MPHKPKTFRPPGQKPAKLFGGNDNRPAYHAWYGTKRWKTARATSYRNSRCASTVRPRDALSPLPTSTTNSRTAATRCCSGPSRIGVADAELIAIGEKRPGNTRRRKLGNRERRQALHPECGRRGHRDRQAPALPGVQSRSTANRNATRDGEINEQAQDCPAWWV